MTTPSMRFTKCVVDCLHIDRVLALAVAHRKDDERTSEGITLVSITPEADKHPKDEGPTSASRDVDTQDPPSCRQGPARTTFL
jgi:hypothetical protein